MTAMVVRADANRLPLADGTVDLVVTSPPYFALRSYTDGGEHYAGQVGDEATPAEFVSALLAVTAECARVLKPTGSIWVNLGDKYAGSRMDGSSDNGTGTTGLAGTASIRDRAAAQGQGTKRHAGGIPTKSLMGLPWRYALGCIDELGLILRAEVIWSKPNGLPESVTDRVRRSHEQWFHFTKAPRYFSGVDEIREPHLTAVPGRRLAGGAPEEGGRRFGPDGSRHTDGHALGKLPGSVWTVATEPLIVPARLGIDHFAAFPTEWPRRIVQGWSPSGVCTACGEGRRPATDKTPMQWRESPTVAGRTAPGTSRKSASGTMLASATTTITGYVCACPTPDAPIRPAVVLDCFGGTGTTALVASALGRVGISCDLSHDYSRLARWRTTDPGERAKAMRVDKPPVEVDGQADLFGEVAS